MGIETPTTRSPRRAKPFPWNAMVYYGEVFGFLLAWVGGALLISQLGSSPDSEQSWDQLAAVEVPVSLGIRPTAVQPELGQPGLEQSGMDASDLGWVPFTGKSPR